MKKYYLLLLLFSSIFGPATAKNQQKEAFTLLDSIGQRSFRATFLYASRSQSDQSLVPFEEGGQIVIHGNKYRITLPEHEVISNGKTVWTYLKNANEVQIMNYDSKEARTLWAIFANYRRDYTLEHYYDATHPYGITVALLAKDPETSITKVSITVTPDTKYIRSIEVTDKNQTLHTLLIEDFEYDLKFDKAFFSFDTAEHKEVEVIDMR